MSMNIGIFLVAALCYRKIQAVFYQRIPSAESYSMDSFIVGKEYLPLVSKTNGLEVWGYYSSLVPVL